MHKNSIGQALLCALIGLALLSSLSISTASATSNRETTGKTTAFDLQFIDMMVPHHQGAVAMAQIALRRAQHPRLRQLARSIIAGQNREISQMRSWRKAWYGSAQTPSMAHMPMLPGVAMPAMNMSMDLRRLQIARPFDRAFLDAMTPHHQSAVVAARAELARGTRPQLRALARTIITTQKREIREMHAWRVNWHDSGIMSGMGH